MVKMAKVFKNGASQAVRLPKEFRFDCDEVVIKKVGSLVLLYPKDKVRDCLEDPTSLVDEGAAAGQKRSTGATSDLGDDEICVKRVGSAVMVFPKSKAWDIMEGALGKVDDDFMADRNQPKRPDKRKPL